MNAQARILGLAVVLSVMSGAHPADAAPSVFRGLRLAGRPASLSQLLSERGRPGSGALSRLQAAVFRAVYNPWVSKKPRARADRAYEGSMLREAIAAATPSQLLQLVAGRMRGKPLRFSSCSFSGTSKKASVGVNIGDKRLNLTVPFPVARQLADAFWKAAP